MRIRNMCIKNPTCVACLQIISILAYLRLFDLRSQVYSCTATSICKTFISALIEFCSHMEYDSFAKNMCDWPWDKSGCHDMSGLHQKDWSLSVDWAAGCPGTESSWPIPSGWASRCPAGAPPQSLHMQKIHTVRTSTPVSCIKITVWRDLQYLVYMCAGYRTHMPPHIGRRQTTTKKCIYVVILQSRKVLQNQTAVQTVQTICT